MDFELLTDQRCRLNVSVCSFAHLSLSQSYNILILYALELTDINNVKLCIIPNSRIILLLDYNIWIGLCHTIRIRKRHNKTNQCVLAFRFHVSITVIWIGWNRLCPVDIQAHVRLPNTIRIPSHPITIQLVYLLFSAPGRIRITRIRNEIIWNRGKAIKLITSWHTHRYRILYMQAINSGLFLLNLSSSTGYCQSATLTMRYDWNRLLLCEI